MLEIDQEIIRVYRQQTYRSNPSLRIHTKSEAVRFVNQRGFVFFWPIKGFLLPSLWVAAAGDRPVADEHDDPGHITWGWKDELLGKGEWYYGRVLARKNCMISLDCLPHFYALSPNYGEPETDYLDDYHKGYLSLEAKNVYEVLLQEGPLDSISLRKASHLSGSGSESRFNRALEILQTSLRIVPCGTSTKGAWHYSFVYDVFHRHYFPFIEKSRLIPESVARSNLIEKYLYSVGGCTMRDISRVFRWSIDSTTQAVRLLSQTRSIVCDLTVKGEKEKYICISEML